jgi:hypothetical protein
MRTDTYEGEPHEQGSTSFTLFVIIACCIFALGLALFLFLMLGDDGGIVKDPFSNFPVQPQ